jgi:hypothetical protein
LEVGAAGRREPKPGRHPFIYETWGLPGVIMPGGDVVHGRTSTRTEPHTAIEFALHVSTRAEGQGPSVGEVTTSTVLAGTRPLELRRNCWSAPGRLPVASCHISGQKDGVFFRIGWSRPEIASETIFAAAADLFDRYVVEGPKLGR